MKLDINKKDLVFYNNGTYSWLCYKAIDLFINLGMIVYTNKQIKFTHKFNNNYYRAKYELKI